MRLRPQSFALFSVLVPGLLAVPVMTTTEPAPRPVAPVVVELDVSGVDAAAAEQIGLPRNAVRREGAPSTVVLTSPQGTRPFEMVGVTWDRDDAVGEVLVEVRTRSNGRWSDWVALEDEGSPVTEGAAEAAQVRPGTEPLWVGEADGVQARVDVASGATPRGLRLALIDPGESPADATAAASKAPYSTAHAQTSSLAPTVRSRSAWGADESIRKGSPSYASTLRAVTLHHSASSNSYSAADVPGIIRGFYAYHVRSQGWSDIGYNFLVDKFGTVWEGRHGGTTRNVIGAHAGGFNTGTSGVSMIGTYETATPPAAMRESVARVAAWRMHLAGINPKGTVAMTSGGSTRYKSGTVVTLPTLFGHRDVSATACPGVQGQASLPGLRDRAAALIAGAPPVAAEPEPEPPPVAPAPDLPPPAVVVPNGLDISSPATVATGATVDLVVHGTAGDPVEVWFARRGEQSFNRRRSGVLGADGSFRTSYVGADDHTYFAVSGSRSSARRTTRVSSPPPMVTGAPPVIEVKAAPTADAGTGVEIVVKGSAGAEVGVWFRRRGQETWTRLRSGRFDATGTYWTSYVGNDDHEYFATSGSLGSADAGTTVVPVLTGPPSVLLGATVALSGRARPGDAVVVERRRRGTTTFERSTLKADAGGAFATSYTADDEYEYRSLAASRIGTLRRTTVSPTGIGPASVRRGSSVALSGTARPGATVELWFRDEGGPVARSGSPLRRSAPPRFVRGRTLTADGQGAWSTSFVASSPHSWYATSDGNASPVRLTTPQ